ncbi:folliculin-interacting protein 1 isoform X1 [Vanessa cardui]|uniref:folliculin-interacting protein 1 isoform X1 n=1 Tax=Vanessa cardui TaxID=171605 RepID=UPI001F13E519|nr:folliculin-interacting protein 1 isoform X1 [Vanessa cardui]
MALIDNIFSNKRKLNYDYWDSRNRGRSCEITSQQVRLLLYKECDRRGRKVLFDSSTIERLPAHKNDKPDYRNTDKIPCIMEVSNGYTYVYKGQATDASVLGEMIFGAVAMNCKSVSLKIHIMNDPRRLMCTKIFNVPPSRISRTKTEAKSSGLLTTRSTPLNVPLLKEEGVSLSFSMDRGDSGFYGEQSPYSSVGSTYDYFSMFDTWDVNATDEYCFYTPCGRKLSCSSNGSWQRRTFQSMATKFDLGQANYLNVPTSSTVSSVDSQIYSSSSTSGTTDSLASSTSVVTRRGKLGLALLITVAESTDMDLIRRCMEHSPQLQALVCRLRLATLAAGTGNAFVSTLYKAAGDAARWLSDLMCGPRLQPVWLDLVTSEPRAANKIADTFLSDLCSVLAVGDTKNTNFFISTLLTYVLTHHLGWVSTVSPYDPIDPQKCTSEQLDTRRPYNALWAQLTDLCGSIGYPPRSARTIITGSKNVQFVKKLLAVLTYFVRCGDVRKNDFTYQDCLLNEPKIVNVNNQQNSDISRTTESVEVNECSVKDSLKVPSLSRNSGVSVSTLISSEVSLKKSTTMVDLNQKLSSSDFAMDSCSGESQNKTLRRLPTMMTSLKTSSDSSPNLSEECDAKKVVFVLGDDDKLVGLKNKSNGRKSVKKSAKSHEPDDAKHQEKTENCSNDCDKDKSSRSSESPSKCCGQTLQHSKPIKHSGFKFEFDKYPQIVTNYMKSKNLEILDRHYIGKPGNLKLDNFQFDPTFVPPIQEERCEACYKCQLMESMLQTPTNASEMEYMNDIPRHTEPQFAKETLVEDTHREMSPKTFVRKVKENTMIVNIDSKPDECSGYGEVGAEDKRNKPVDRNKRLEVKQVIEFPLSQVSSSKLHTQVRSGYEASLLGGLTNNYVPDLVLQGTVANSNTWEADLRRDLDLTSYLNKTLDPPVQSIAIVGDTNSWEVSLVGRECGCGGLSPLVGGALDALPAMRRARVPPQQCLLYLESKLREFCVLSKTLADMLMSTDFCDIATLTKSLNIDVNDVPLLLAVATTHTPQVAKRYGISYR